MRILKIGNKPLPKEIEYIKKCSVCGTVFTYKEDDINYGRIWNEHWLKCPYCHYYLGVPFFKRKYKPNKYKSKVEDE